MRAELADKVWEERLKQLVLLLKILKGNNIFKGSGSKIKKNISELLDNLAFTWAFFFSVPHVLAWFVWFRIQNKCKTVHSNIEFMQIPKIINIANRRSNMKVQKHHTHL